MLCEQDEMLWTAADSWSRDCRVLMQGIYNCHTWFEGLIGHQYTCRSGRVVSATIFLIGHRAALFKASFFPKILVNFIYAGHKRYIVT